MRSRLTLSCIGHVVPACELILGGTSTGLGSVESPTMCEHRRPSREIMQNQLQEHKEANKSTWNIMHTFSKEISTSMSTVCERNASERCWYRRCGKTSKEYLSTGGVHGRPAKYFSVDVVLADPKKTTAGQSPGSLMETN